MVRCGRITAIVIAELSSATSCLHVLAISSIHLCPHLVCTVKPMPATCIGRSRLRRRIARVPDIPTTSCNKRSKLYTIQLMQEGTIGNYKPTKCNCARMWKKQPTEWIPLDVEGRPTRYTVHAAISRSRRRILCRPTPWNESPTGLVLIGG